MTSVISITSDRELNLKPGASEDLPILITNQSGHAMRARASLEVSDAALEDHVKIVKGDLIWDFAENGVRQLVARIELPKNMPGGKYRLASSFVLQNEPGPVALAYSPDIKPRVHFSTCWGCPGETGKALFRKPETVVIVQP